MIEMDLKERPHRREGKKVSGGHVFARGRVPQISDASGITADVHVFSGTGVLAGCFLESVLLLHDR